MRRLPPLNAIKAFEAAARHMSFKQAAAELGVTPTAVSHQIRLLEETIGQSLFRRHPRPMILTDVGAALFPSFRDTLDQLDRAISEVSTPKRDSVLRVSTTVAFASNVLLPRLSDWAARMPGVDLDIHASDLPVDLLDAGVDLAVRYAAEPDGTMVWQKLCSDRFVPMAAPGLEGDVLDLPLIAYNWKSPHVAEPTWEKWQEMASRHGIRADGKLQKLRLSEESHAIDAAVAGQGVVLASSIIAFTKVQQRQLLPISDISLPGLSYFCVYAPHQGECSTIATFRSWLGEILNDQRLFTPALAAE